MTHSYTTFFFGYYRTFANNGKKYISSCRRNNQKNESCMDYHYSSKILCNLTDLSKKKFDLTQDIITTKTSFEDLTDNV